MFFGLKLYAAIFGNFLFNYDEHKVACCVRSYHNYFIKTYGKLLLVTLSCERKLSNSKDRYAVAVTEHETVVAHLLLKVCFLFLKRGSIIDCVLTMILC